MFTRDGNGAVLANDAVEMLFMGIPHILPPVVPPTMSIRYKRSSSVKEQTLGTQELTREVLNHH